MNDTLEYSIALDITTDGQNLDDVRKFISRLQEFVTTSAPGSSINAKVRSTTVTEHKSLGDMRHWRVVK